MERCYVVDEKLSRLARDFPDTKFLRARAAVLGFASSTKRKIKPALVRSKPPRHDDEDDPYAIEDGASSENEGAGADNFLDDDVDLDMLPTMLVYRNGDLVHNWVRVDWEAGDAGVTELLER